MRIFPKELKIGDYDGFTEELDIFKRKEFGEGLGTLFERVEDPMVAVLDAPWGAGKSTFIKMWCGAMRKKGFPVIYFDAFKNDYSNDAFIAIAGEVVALSDELLGETHERDEFIKSSLTVAKRVSLAAIKGGAKKLAEKCIGEYGVSDVAEAVTQGGVDSVIDSIDVYLQDRLKGRTQEKNAFENFGATLEDLSNKLSDAALVKASKKPQEQKEGPDDSDAVKDNPTPLPLIFVIDELDRCRPPFALEVIERIKHFFSVPGVHFLLVTHLEQLENSVRYAYGMDEGSDVYLQKFYNVVVYLPSEGNYGKSQTSIYLDSIFKDYPSDGEGGEYSESIKEIIERYATSHQMTLRTIEKVSTHIAILLAVTNKRFLRISEIVCGLCIIKALNSRLYKNILNGSATYEDVCAFLKLKDMRTSGETVDYTDQAWAWVLADDDILKSHPKIISLYEWTIARYTLRNRHELLRVLCRRLESYAFV